MAVSRRHMAFFLLLFAHSAMAARGGPWGAGFDVSILSDDNITRAQASGDIEKDLVTRINVNASYSLDFSLNGALILTGRLLNEHYRDFDGVSSVRAGLEAEYLFRTRTGFTAPVYAVFISSTQADYKTDIRDGSVLDYGLRIRRQLTDRIAIAAGAEQSERTADGRVFDLEQTRYFVHSDYRMSGRFQAYLAYYYINGDTYSISSVSPAAVLTGGGYYDAVEWDPAFSGVQRRWVYRVDARTDVIRLGFNIAIDRNNSIDISADNIGSEAPGSNGGYLGGGDALTYDTTVVSADYFHRF